MRSMAETGLNNYRRLHVRQPLGILAMAGLVIRAEEPVPRGTIIASRATSRPYTFRATCI